MFLKNLHRIYFMFGSILYTIYLVNILRMQWIYISFNMYILKYVPWFQYLNIS